VLPFDGFATATAEVLGRKHEEVVGDATKDGIKPRLRTGSFVTAA